ncbi:unnamed protein product [Rhodiola kirilowii]
MGVPTDDAVVIQRPKTPGEAGGRDGELSGQDRARVRYCPDHIRFRTLRRQRRSIDRWSLVLHSIVSDSLRENLTSSQMVKFESIVSYPPVRHAQC